MTIKYGGAVKTVSALSIAILALFPVFASAAFVDKSSAGRIQIASISQPQLDGLNTSVFSDAWLTAKIIGFDPSELDQMKADIQALKNENAQLRDQLSNRPASVINASAPVPSSAVDMRMTTLEKKMDSLQGTLSAVVSMLTMLLGKL